MRYPAAEKLEIIRLVEQSHLPVRRVLEQIGIPRSTFYRWCDLYQTGGPEALDDRSPRPDRVWNRIPDDVRARSTDTSVASILCAKVRANCAPLNGKKNIRSLPHHAITQMQGPVVDPASISCRLVG
jgi:transposase-like protein